MECRVNPICLERHYIMEIEVFQKLLIIARETPLLHVKLFVGL